MSTSKKGILKLINEIKDKTLSKEKLIENIKEIGNIGSKNLAEDLIPLLDEFDDGDVKFQIRETLTKLGITPYYMNDEGIKREDAGDVDGAIRKYELCVILDPYYHWAYYNMARMYADKKGDNQKGIELYKKAVEVNKNYGDGWNNLGNVYSKINQISQARHAYEQAAKCTGYKSLHFPYYNLGLLYAKMGNNQKALENYLKSIEVKNDYAKAIFNAAKTYKEMGEPEKANEYFAIAIKNDQTYEQDVKNLGVVVEEVLTMQLLKNLDGFEPSQEKLEKKESKDIKKGHGVR
jgi:tetratricopeptide (TPR) repeat protein